MPYRTRPPVFNYHLGERVRMFDTIVIATDGSDSVRRAVDVAVDVAARFDAEVHAVYVVDSGEVESTPDEVRDDLRDALDDHGEAALDQVTDAATARDADLDITIEAREGTAGGRDLKYARDRRRRGRDGDARATRGESVPRRLGRRARRPDVSDSRAHRPTAHRRGPAGGRQSEGPRRTTI